MNEDELLEDRDDDSNLVRDLRAQLRKAKAAEKAAVDEASKLKADNRQSSIAKILADKKLPDKVLKLIPADVVDEAGVNTWLEEYGDVFGIAEPDPQGGEQTDVVPPEVAGVDPAVLAAFSRAQAAATEGQPVLAPGIAGKLNAMQELAGKAKTMDEFIAGLSNLG